MRQFFITAAIGVLTSVAFLSPCLAQSQDTYSRDDDEDEEEESGGGGGGSSGYSTGGGWSTYGDTGGDYIFVPDSSGNGRGVVISPPQTADRDVASAQSGAGEGRATRIFAGPGMFPPEHFAAYAIVAFKSRPLPSDRDRFVSICQGYVAAILAYTEVEVPLDQQLVTVWPVSHDYVAVAAMSESGLTGCDKAVDEYGLATSLAALEDARAALDADDIETLQDRRGPFVLAWSPTHQKGAQDALILRMDLSGVETAIQAREKFEAWRDEIEAKQDLWIDGWKEDTLSDTIGNWADRWGNEILSFLGKD
ncbi:hypothetical protein FGK63_06910 [Ruegeria sediminis]|uniref:Secreted protein n=1 Tax=Ruegeria sediminis TaxID=2583820 RepID=A0ABY2X0S8_9RHOB|nr:hypothetical protein [Ruegeria sediminis]TMV08843.1 hypothetical protein FGK63_06910 [Ruegeria sediminis]